MVEVEGRHEGWVEGEARGVRGEWREEEEGRKEGVWTLFLENVQSFQKGKYFCQVREAFM